MAEVNKETTITTKVSHWTKYLVKKALGNAPKPDGTIPNQGEFMEASVNLRATRILRNAKEYDIIKKNYEDFYGPIEEIVDGSEKATVEDKNGEAKEVEAAIDPHFEETKES